LFVISAFGRKNKRSHLFEENHSLKHLKTIDKIPDDETAKENNSELSLSRPYYPTPNGNLPLLSQAASLVSSDEFHFDKKTAVVPLPRPASEQPATANDDNQFVNNAGAMVHRRQKIKRKRFRLVFYVRFFSHSNV
jgi:hypothetical protein